MRRSALTVWLPLCLPLVFTACATIAPPLPPSLELPKPPSDLRATRRGDRVTLTWTAPAVTTDRQTARSVGPTRICRGIGQPLTQCGTSIGEAPAELAPNAPQLSKAKGTRSYADTLPSQLQTDDPSRFVTYAVEALNAGGRGAGLSNQVRISLARTLPPPHDFSASVTGQGVVLHWTSDISPADSAPPTHYLYRIYRRLEGGQEQILAGQVPVGSERSITFIDSNIEWERSYEYHAGIVTVIASDNKPETQVEGDDTPEVKVFAHDTFPPAVPSGLQAVSSGPGQKTFVDLVWAPVSDVDLDGYNVYRHEEGSAPIKLNAEPLKTPAYRDLTVSPGKTYSYSVSAIDVRGNESAHSEEASEVVP
jgi:hypothetical protein